MVRVILVASDGTHVEVKTDASYSPDIVEDCATRAHNLLAETLRDQAHLLTDLGGAA